jgi:Na+-transporting methylmalonyl-CoA/oxaloacetate decarboxylase gamma subunit
MSAVGQALKVMGIGLPVMFICILIFMALTVLIKKIFPYVPEPEAEENSEG